MFFKIWFFLVLLFKLSSSIQDPTLELFTGKILGAQKTTFAGTTYYSFQKIPYAEPPLGNLRFKAPHPALNWDGILNGTVLDISCYQLGEHSSSDSEDCLYLNVYTPELPENDDNPLLPVMVHIHGGGFVSGSSMLQSPDLFVDNGVILVTLNYRLGPFGFLSTQDDTILGNNGLKDQKLALQWIHDNICVFGGDPNKITVFGQGAGAASISYQLLNTTSTGLFRAVILQSGTCLSPASFQRNPRSVAFETAALLNTTFTSSNDSVSLLEFLRSVSANDLNEAAEQYIAQKSTSWDFDLGRRSFFAPVIEAWNSDALITEKMFRRIRGGYLIKVPTMLGITSEESVYFHQIPRDLQTDLDEINVDRTVVVPDDMQITVPSRLVSISWSLINIYSELELGFFLEQSEGIKYFSDNIFGRSAIKYAELYSVFAETYFYQFSYDGDIGNISVNYEGAESVGHGEDVRYLTCSGTECSFEEYPEKDRITSQRLVKLWTNFVKYLNPTPEGDELLQNITWPRLSVQESDFLYLDINENLEIKNNPKQEVMEKWNFYYDNLGFYDFDTY